MTTAIAIRRRELNLEQQKMLLDTAGRAAGGAKAIIIKALDSPVFNMVASVTLIEWLQTVQIWDSTPQGPGGQAGPNRRPLISQALATTLEATIISTEALKSIGGLGGLGGLLAGLLK